jgi:hypothetical protein
MAVRQQSSRGYCSKFRLIPNEDKIVILVLRASVEAACRPRSFLASRDSAVLLSFHSGWLPSMEIPGSREQIPARHRHLVPVMHLFDFPGPCFPGSKDSRLRGRAEMLLRVGLLPQSRVELAILCQPAELLPRVTQPQQEVHWLRVKGSQLAKRLD